MTDLEKVKELLTALDITFYEKNLQLIVEAKEGKKVKGYLGFFTEFNFDEEGKFIDLGIWE